jgi:twitching motility protein PilT
MCVTPGVRALIREGKTHQLYSQIQTGGRLGMKTMATSLAALVANGRIRLEDAMRSLSDPGELQSLVRGAA